MTGDILIALDQGTTSTRAIAFSAEGKVLTLARREFQQHYPKAGWVEHDLEDIWADTLDVLREIMTKAHLSHENIRGIGITNQRETTALWNRQTGAPVGRAIVWQDRRTADWCAKRKAEGLEKEVRERTGLLLDPYFSGSKIAWMLEHNPEAGRLAKAGKLAFGTIDSFLLWRLTGGTVHASDATNAARTMLYNLKEGRWDATLCEAFSIPQDILPDVHDNAHLYGETTSDILGGPVPIAGMAGDQHAALFGQACFEPGMIKSTYGTGCFALQNTGTTFTPSKKGLLTTLGYQLDGKPTYALEGSIFVAGATIQWLRDKMGLIPQASATHSMAASIEEDHGLYLVPAFVGLGAPHWRPDVRGMIYGLTLDTGPAHLARAALESVAFQSYDLAAAMQEDSGLELPTLRVDGGMVANDWLCQFLADILNVPVARPAVIETTAMGAAFLAGLATGLYASLDEIQAIWKQERTFRPQMDKATRSALVSGWHHAIAKILHTV